MPSTHIDSIIESVDLISRDERDAPLTQYITNAGITHGRYTITHFKHNHHVVRLISNQMSVRYAPKQNSRTVRFTLDRLMKTEVKRLLNGL